MIIKELALGQRLSLSKKPLSISIKFNLNLENQRPTEEL
jgi:hypothetical protein